MLTVNNFFSTIINLVTWGIYSLVAVMAAMTVVLAEGNFARRHLEYDRRRSHEPIDDETFERTVQEKKRKDRQTVYPVMGITLSAVVLLNYLARKYLAIMGPSTTRLFLGTLVVVGFSSLLFYVKVNNLRAYSIMEGLFAVASCAYSLSHNMGGLSGKLGSAEVITLVSSVYLMIRAGDNFKKDLDNRKAAAWAEWSRKVDIQQNQHVRDNSGP